MFHTKIVPRISETDALGHINNTVLSVWFDEARRPIYEIFTPGLARENWCLIMARSEIDVVGQIFLGGDVGISTAIERLGSSSIIFAQEAEQGDRVVARSRATWVHFNFETQKPKPIPDDLRRRLNESDAFSNPETAT
ncbi:acyl-CoA thioesterase [Hoeflea sp. TYP-13]|uniref:acyl-CoA thioesterase n=1 Tax=Hoeflea sp. TYP-13 TaxID=3230023 RepID=UPI0034C604E3